MNNIEYEGPFKDHIQSHVELKRAVGYKYDTEAIHFKRFDKFTQEKYPDATELKKEIVLDWCSKKKYESQANQCRSEEHTSELQSRGHLVCRLLLEKKKKKIRRYSER